MKTSVREAAERIAAMEVCYDALCAAASAPACLGKSPDLHCCLETLERYYCGGQWLADYTLDEQGLLPQDLKRGVLSQDGVYDLLERLRGAL